MNKVFLLAMLMGVGVSIQSVGQGAKKTTPTSTQPKPTSTQPKQTTQPSQAFPATSQPTGNGQLGGAGTGAGATGANTATSNSPSIRPIPESDIMYKRTVWRVIDLREKQNKPMFSMNREITRVMLDAVKRGELQVYQNDSLKKAYTTDEYRTRLVKPGEQIVESEEDIQARLEQDKILAKIEAAKKKQMGAKYVAPASTGSSAMGPIEYDPKDIKRLEIKEDAIFDKKRSRMYFDIQAITLKGFDPSTGTDVDLGTFAYKDLVKVFRNHPQEAVWYNMQNDAQHKNLADAFDLRLFSSYIKKVSNASDDDLAAIHGGSQQAILAAQRAMEELIEFEYSLWSY